MKKLTNYILDLGRVIAFYPGLKKITGSTNASILLCQLLYWTDKTRDDGWIYKTADEIEEETGLTYHEQKSAREILVEKIGVVEEEFKRLDHTSRYRVNQYALNVAWEKATTDEKPVTKVRKAPKKQKKPTPSNLLKGEQLVLPSVIEPIASTEISKEFPVSTSIVSDLPVTNRSGVEKKGDWADAMIAFNQSPAGEKERERKRIKGLFESKLHINLNTPSWHTFIDFVYTRETKHKENPELFINWALANGFDPVYWNAKKMISLYPQAYINKNNTEMPDDFVDKLPEPKEEIFAPMPRDMVKKKVL